MMHEIQSQVVTIEALKVPGVNSYMIRSHKMDVNTRCERGHGNKENA